jgi:hypothetical protein
MSSLSLHTIGLKPVQMKAVTRRAKKEGKTLPEYVRALIERDLLLSGSFDELLRPIREGFKNAGVTDEQLDSLVTKARKDIHARSHRKVRK